MDNNIIKIPSKGSAIFATKAHPSLEEDSYIGEVIKIDRGICQYDDKRGGIDSFIWKFKNGLNKFHYFEG